MKRPDRAQKLQERKENSETVVKSGLTGHLRLKDQKAELFLEEVVKRVVACSKRTVHASLALNLLVQESFEGYEDVCEVPNIPEFTNATLLRQLMLGTLEAKDPIPEVTTLFERHPKLLYNPKDRHHSDRNIYSAAATRLVTNIKNHLALNLPRVIFKYLNSFEQFERDAITWCNARIHGWSPNPNFPMVPSLSMVEVPKQVRRILGLDEGVKLEEKWLKKKENLPGVLRFFVHASRRLVQVEKPTFALLPVCRVRSHFLTLDAHSMYGVMRDGDAIPWEQSAKEYVGAHKEVVRRVFKVPNKKGFTGTLETDGVSVCFHFSKPKREGGHAPAPTPELHATGRVVGIDPGRTNIFTAAEILEDGSIRSLALSRSQYYKESGMTKSRGHTEHWNSHIQKELTKLSRVSPKSPSVEGFRKYLEVFFEVERKLWGEYTRRRWARQRLALYGGKKRTFARFLNRLEDGKTLTLAYGAAQFDPGGKGEVSVPTTRAFKECAARFRTVLVDEFRTTRVSWKDDSVLEPVGRRDLRVAVRGLYRCCSTEGNKFVDRDVNAALNIRRCAVGPRPRVLDRKFVEGRLPDPSIRCWIRR